MQVNFSKYSKQLMVAAGLLALPLSWRLEKPAQAERSKEATTPRPKQALLPTTPSDPRTSRLKTFFNRLHCPVLDLAEDFVHAADDNRLDWRLLPSISVVESGGGKQARNNNIFGWSNGNMPFPTIRSGLHEIAYKLGRSPIYQNRDSYGKLLVYNNNNPEYADQVVRVMNQISPVLTIKPVSRIATRRIEPQYTRN